MWVWWFFPLSFLFFRPVHGLIFLFKWQPGEEPAGSVVQDSRLDTIFFAKQVRQVQYFSLICHEIHLLIAKNNGFVNMYRKINFQGEITLINSVGVGTVC